MASDIVSGDEALHFLASKGFLPLLVADHEGMVDAYSRLFGLSASYFDLPEDSPEKTSVQAPNGARASEQGYSKIPGEKSILTVRTHDTCPPILHHPLAQAWNVTGAFLAGICRSIAISLQLDPEVFAPFVEACKNLSPAPRTPTMLRMFRYDRPTGTEPIVTAEQHRDLGILSLVVGHSPGLQVLDQDSSQWIPIEEDSVIPPEAKTRSGGLTATLLVGETLSFLTRGCYKPGIHRVLCAPDGDHQYRFSIVFALRPAVTPVYTRNFESEITGTFPEEQRMEGQCSSVFMRQLVATNWNVNVKKELRDEQQKRLQGQKAVPKGGSE